MARQTLAVKYRPATFDDVVEQSAIKDILMDQIETGTFQHSYLFCGPAGCGKTTAARIFANDINGGKGSPIEVDAASNNGVDNVRDIMTALVVSLWIATIKRTSSMSVICSVSVRGMLC